jgi:hypothetical protein
MVLRCMGWRTALRIILFACVCMQWMLSANATSCKTESQMTPAERDGLSNAAHLLIRAVQSGDV